MSVSDLQHVIEQLPPAQELRRAQAEHLAAAGVLKGLIAAAEAKERAGLATRGKPVRTAKE
jgi:hypothetical protein